MDKLSSVCCCCVEFFAASILMFSTSELLLNVCREYFMLPLNSYSLLFDGSFDSLRLEIRFELRRRLVFVVFES